MIARVTAHRIRPTLSPSALALIAAVVVSITTLADAEASDYICQLPIEGTEAVQESFGEYYECVEPEVDKWLAQHPREVERLRFHYELWEFSRDHDLRDRDAAREFVEAHPVDFSERDVELTAEQIEAQTPQVETQPAGIDGMFQRFFIDRSAARMFLTTDSEGLVSLDISQRYDFDVEGAVGEAGAEDFYVIDDETAVVEEPSDAGHARDLVVLDISDRSDPREIHRLHGVLPNMDETNVSVRSLPDRPPTFEEYRAIREGHFRIRDCGQPPSVTSYHNQHCRPDGTCYLLERHRTPLSGATCERATNRQRLTHRRAAPRTPRQQRRHGRIGRGATGSAAPSPQPESTTAEMDTADDAGPVEFFGDVDTGSADRVEAAERVESADAMPEGGAGGAGSLSQMMVHDSMLFVLSADHDEETGWLSTFDISDPREPTPMHLIGLDNGPEALQAHEELLLVAGRDALLVASVADREGPRLLGERRQRCPVNFDPVVMEGSTAYRTVIIDNPRTRCRSRLEVIDLKKPYAPRLRTTESINRPRGLAVLGDRLFVADERTGVRLFDITDRTDPEQVHTWRIPGVKDLVISDFDLYALTSDKISTLYVGSLFERGVSLKSSAADVQVHPTVVRGD